MLQPKSKNNTSNKIDCPQLQQDFRSNFHFFLVKSSTCFPLLFFGSHTLLDTYVRQRSLAQIVFYSPIGMVEGEIVGSKPIGACVLYKF